MPSLSLYSIVLGLNDKLILITLQISIQNLWQAATYLAA